MLKIKSQSGFTLIELLIVIAIIGIMSTLSIVTLNSARAKARDAKRLSDVKQIRTALDLYYMEMGEYPTSTMIMSPENGLYNKSYCLQSGTGFSLMPCSPANGIIFMSPVPLPPSPADGACKEANTYGFDGDNGVMISKNFYYYIKYPDRYEMEFCLGAATAGVTAGLHKVTQEGIQ